MNEDEIDKFIKNIDSEINAEDNKITNFPKSGDNQEITLSNSQYPQFDYDYASKLKEDYPSIWSKGGNSQETSFNGNDAFRMWTAVKSGEDTAETKNWIKRRERFVNRFKGNVSSVGGHVALIKWAYGESDTKSIINEEKKKIDEENSNLSSTTEKNIVSNTNNTYIEICEMSEEDLAGRVRIKMSSHLIHPEKEQWNKNGITWIEEYTQDNIKSAIGMDYVVSWADEENQIPSGHGTMTYDDDGNVQFEGVVVGSVHDAYIADVEIDGQVKKLMMTEGYINSQRYPLFVKWLKEEITSGKVHGSIEINGKGKAKRIIYLDGDKNLDGTKKMGRIPTIFDFSGLAILSSIEEPADDDSIVFEVNSKQDSLNINNINNKEEGGKQEGMNLIFKSKTIEINNLDSYELEKLLIKAFRISIEDICDCDDHGYYVSKLYPINAEFIVEKWNRNGENKYYKSSYSIEESNKVVLGDIYEVERSWSPINNEKPIEINIGGGMEMDKELQAKYEAMAKDLEVMSANYETMKANYENMEKEKEVMMKEMEEKNAKMSEVNEALVNANKMMEESNAKCETMMEEMNGYKEKYETMMAEKNTAEAEAEKATKLAEVNTYFETEISKNGFEEAEVNTLKSFVETLDLDGLKRAEAELCAKKFKEMVAKNANTDTEVNSANDMFISIKEKEMKKVPGSIPSFFN